MPPLSCAPAARKGTHTQGAAATATVQSIPGIAAPLLPSPGVQVSTAASEAMLAACGTAGNRDLEPHIPALVSCVAKPAEVPDVIAKLSATTFVQVGAAYATLFCPGGCCVRHFVLSRWVLRLPLCPGGCCVRRCRGGAQGAAAAAVLALAAWLSLRRRHGGRPQRRAQMGPGCSAAASLGEESAQRNLTSWIQVASTHVLPSPRCRRWRTAALP